MTYREAREKIFRANPIESNFVNWRGYYMQEFNNKINRYNRIKEFSNDRIDLKRCIQALMRYHQGINVIDIERIRRRHC